MLDGQVEGLLGNSFILRLCQKHYRLIPLFFLWFLLRWMGDLKEGMGEIGYKRFILLLLSMVSPQHFRFVSKTFQTLRRNKNFRKYGNLVLYPMKYNFRMVKPILASTGQLYARHLTWKISQGLTA